MFREFLVFLGAFGDVFRGSTSVIMTALGTKLPRSDLVTLL